MAWLKDAIERRGLTVRRVANTLDVSTATVYDWDTGKIRPRDKHAARLAELLDMDEFEVRRALGLWVPHTLQQLRIELATAQRQLALLEEAAETDRERWIIDQVREILKDPSSAPEDLPK